MESKKTFGEYIRERRRAMGLTQREFAEKLYVTESAVSKWERGMSYPDVTLLRDICAVLGVTEHELLTASEDTERCSADRLAAKYLRLTRNYRAALYILFGAVLLGCAIGNLAAQGTLSWFWIVLAAVGLAASPTLVPALAIMNPKTEGVKWHLAAASFLVWLELLLLICCLYTGGTWFPVAGTAVLFGAGLVLLPPLLPSLPGPEWLPGRKTALCLAVETALLLLLLLVCVLSYGGTWFPGGGHGVSLRPEPDLCPGVPPAAPSAPLLPGQKAHPVSGRGDRPVPAAASGVPAGLRRGLVDYFYGRSPPPAA